MEKLKVASISRVARYTFFGLITTAINILVFKQLIDIGVNYQLSCVLSFIVAIVFAFVSNRKLVFDSNAATLYDNIVEFAKFIVSRVLTLIVEMFGMYILFQVFKQDVMVSKLFMNALVIIMNFLLSKYYIFARTNV